MKKFLVASLIAVAALSSMDAFARAGGGVSVGRSSSFSSGSSRSFSSPSYSSRPSYSAPSYTPRPPTYSAPVAPAPSVQHSGVGTFGQSLGGSLVGSTVGTMLGNAMSRPSSTVVQGGGVAPVAVAPSGEAMVPQAGYAGGYAQPVVVQQSSGFPWGWFWFIVLTGGIGALIYFYMTRRKEVVELMTKDDFDALSYFYKVQQASMSNDKTTLNKLCTAGVATVLADNPEPDRVAAKTLTGVTYEFVEEDTIKYTFTDTIEGKRVSEYWMFTPSMKLEGIEQV